MKVVSHAATLMLMAAPRGPRFSSADRLASRQSAAIDQLSPQSMNQSASRVEVREERRRRGSGCWPSLAISCVLGTRNVPFVIASRIVVFPISSHSHLTHSNQCLAHRAIIVVLSSFRTSHRTPPINIIVWRPRGVTSR